MQQRNKYLSLQDQQSTSSLIKGGLKSVAAQDHQHQPPSAAGNARHITYTLNPKP